MAGKTIVRVLDQNVEIPHREIPVGGHDPQTSIVGQLADLAKTLQQLGFVLVLVYDESENALRPTAFPQEYES